MKLYKYNLSSQFQLNQTLFYRMCIIGLQIN